ncbi:MAG: flagellar hook-length control protein FliK [Comamonadaceae bacterium]
MDANQFFTIANQSTSSWDSLGQGNPAATVPPAKTGFADLFNGQMIGQVRQDFAAPASGQVDLQLVSLGPKMNLITAAAPLPDLNSLASFARAQGLDEEAVRTLFGNAAADAAPATSALAGQNPPQVAIDSASALANALGVAPDTQGAASTMSANVQGIFLRPDSVANAGVLPQAASELAQDVALAVGLPEMPRQPDSHRTYGVGDREQSAAQESLGAALSLVGSLGGVAAALPQPAAFQVAAKPTGEIPITPVAVRAADVLAHSPAPGGQAAQIPQTPQTPMPLAPIPLAKPVDPMVASLVSLQVGAGAQPSLKPANVAAAELVPKTVEDVPQVAMRVRLDVQSQDITRRLALMSGSSQKARWSAISTAATSAGMAQAALDKSWETLSLEVPSTLLESLESSSALPLADANVGAAALNPAPADAAKSAAVNSAANSAADPLSESALASQRSAQYQQLADRVGQALGERLLSQIERGEWKLQLRLKPESLGRIDVALAMHSGALDASFASDNSMTRDLILQGSGRLKDALAQSGMAVANVWVGGDQASNRDGNPTPGRSFKGSSGAVRSDEAEALPGVNPLRSTSTTSDGLDVLA